MIGTDIAQDRIVTVFGGSGFLGRHVVRALAARGWRVRIASRRPDLAFHTQTNGRVGQVMAVQANLRYPASVAAAIQGASAVVNLVGILSEHGRQNFQAVHVEGARAVAAATRAAGIGTLVQVSAIGADPQSRGVYGRTKAQAEAAVRENVPSAIILRPSLLFGPEDSFFNRFANIARLSPMLPLIGGGTTKFQPVYVGDVAEAVARAASGEAQAGATYELGGPSVRSFKELMEFVCAVTGRKRLMPNVPFGLLGGPAAVTETLDGLLMGKFPQDFVITRDQLAMLRADNVVSPEAAAAHLTLEGLGITEPHAIESIVPVYLYRFRKTGQFDHDAIIR